MVGRVVGVGELHLGQAHGAHVGHGLGADALEDALGQRRGVLEQAVDPRVEVGVVRHRGGVHAAAAGGVGDDDRRRTVSGGSALVEVQAGLEGRDDRLDARPALGLRGVQGVELVLQPRREGLELAQVRPAALIADGVAGGHHQPDRGDLAAAAAGAVPAGGGVEVGTLEHEALELAVLADRALGEALRRRRQGGGELEALLKGVQHLGVLVQRGQGARAADLDALQAAGALPRVDGRGEQPAGAGGGLLHRVEERARPRDRVDREGGHHLVQGAPQGGLVDVEGGDSCRHDVGERAVGLVRAVGLTDLLGDRVDQPAQGLALGFGDVEVLDGRQQEVVDLVHGVRDRGVRADQGALHAAGA